jgi:hypothetical protein
LTLTPLGDVGDGEERRGKLRFEGEADEAGDELVGVSPAGVDQLDSRLGAG